MPSSDQPAKRRNEANNLLIGQEADPLLIGQEQARVAALHALQILDTEAEQGYDDIVELASHICQTPIALVSLVDEERQWFKARIGLDVSETSRDVSFCHHAIGRQGIFIIPDATADPRFADNPLVTAAPFIRFYAGVPLVTAEGQAIGSLCVIDCVPRSLTPEQCSALEALARQVEGQIALRRASAEQTRLLAQQQATEAALRESHGLLQAVMGGMVDAAFVKDRDGRYLFINDAGAAMLGQSPEEVIGGNDAAFMPEDAARQTRTHDQRIISGGLSETYEDREPVAGGRVFLSTKAAWRNDWGDVAGLVGIARDITESRAAQQALVVQQKRLMEAAQDLAIANEGLAIANDELASTNVRLEVRVGERTADLARQSQRTEMLLNAAGEGFFGLDLLGCSTFVNPAAATMLGYTVEELLDMPMHATLHHTHSDGRHYSREECPIYAALTDGAVHRIVDEVFWRKDKTSFPVEYLSTPIYEQDKLAGAVVTFRDITERKALEAEQARMLAEALDRADHDPLTGLLNHRAFQKKVQEEADRAQRDGTSFAVVMLDLDNFKFFNDAYGHAAGDEVLRQIAAALQAGCRGYDTLARFGGDEFALLLPGAEDAQQIVGALSERLEHIGYFPPGYDTPIPIGASMGVAAFPEEGASRGDVVALADGRLRRAKAGDTEIDDIVARLRERLPASSAEGFAMLTALVTAVDTKDRYTRCHSEDVLIYSLQIAISLGLDEGVRQTIALAALLHDVGKVGVSDSVLRKPGHLSDEEFKAIQQHPVMGAAIVGAVPGFEETLGAVRHHHERWDGKGYPSGLQAEETPLIARLMAVADAFSAMTTDRPYRKGMPQEKALVILQSGAGTQWDPACVNAFVHTWKKRPVRKRVSASEPLVFAEKRQTPIDKLQFSTEKPQFSTEKLQAPIDKEDLLEKQRSLAKRLQALTQRQQAFAERWQTPFGSSSSTL